jgi:hypothetical protein
MTAAREEDMQLLQKTLGVGEDLSEYERDAFADMLSMLHAPSWTRLLWFVYPARGPDVPDCLENAYESPRTWRPIGGQASELRRTGKSTEQASGSDPRQPSASGQIGHCQFRQRPVCFRKVHDASPRIPHPSASSPGRPLARGPGGQAARVPVTPLPHRAGEAFAETEPEAFAADS